MNLEIFVKEDSNVSMGTVTETGYANVPVGNNKPYIKDSAFEAYKADIDTSINIRNTTTNQTAPIVWVSETNEISINGEIFSVGDGYEVTVRNKEYKLVIYDKLDLYDDETIEITESIKDFKDVAKVFADYSQNFKVPASKRNNRILENYYNNDVINGFDARFRRDCILKISGTDWKEGGIRLTGVEMKGGYPESYNIGFFGNTASLKNLIGDDELSSIEELDAFTHSYNYTDIRSYASRGSDLVYTDGIATGITPADDNFYYSPDMIYSFISAKDRYFVDTTESTPNTSGARNLYTSTPSTVNEYTGLLYTDLKPAIKVIRVMEMIARKYGFTFSKDFLNDDSRNVMDSMYLWCSRESGRITNLIDATTSTILTSDFVRSSGSEIRVTNNTEFYTVSRRIGGGRHNHNYATFKFTLTPNNSNGLYSVVIEDENTGEKYVELLENTGTSLISFEMKAPSAYGTTTKYHKPKITIATKGGIASVVLSDVEFSQINNLSSSNPTVTTGVYDDIVTASLSDNVKFTTLSIPKIQTMDFIRNFMKMFNLVMYIKNNEIVLEPLDNYMSKGTTYDITKYCDFTSHNINRGDIYKEINFEYKEPKTVFPIRSNEATGDEYGNERFKSNELIYFDGGKYDVKVEASHTLFERIINKDSQYYTPTTWGYAVSDSFSAVNPESLFFFSKKDSFVVFGLSGGSLYMTDGNTNNVPTSVNRLFMPSNSYIDYRIGDLASINFGSEYSVNGSAIVSNSLFSMYYANYINNIYDSQSRVMTISAVLPTALTLNINLNDTLVIGSDRYIINSIKKNITTNTSDLTLLIDNYTDNINTSNTVSGVTSDGTPIELKSYEWLVFASLNNTCYTEVNQDMPIFISDGKVYGYSSYKQYFYPITGSPSEHRIAGYEFDVIQVDSNGVITNEFDCP